MLLPTYIMITVIMCTYTDYVYLKLLSTSVTDGIVCLCFKTECTLTYRQKMRQIKMDIHVQMKVPNPYFVVFKFLLF